MPRCDWSEVTRERRNGHIYQEASPVEQSTETPVLGRPGTISSGQVPARMSEGVLHNVGIFYRGLDHGK